MKRPAFQFYPKDWRTNLKLRRCSIAARGAWIDVLCLLHDSEEYGVWRFPLKELAEAAGVQLKLLRELAEKGVLKGADRDALPYSFRPNHAGKLGDPVELVAANQSTPCWYCSRFVRDEYIRQRRGSGTQFTSENQPPKTEPKPSPNPPFVDGPSVAVAVAVPKDQNPHTHSAPLDGKFRMRADWTPNPEILAGTALRNGVLPSIVTPDALVDFTGYYADEQAAYTEGQWTQKLIHSARKFAARNSGGANAQHHRNPGLTAATLDDTSWIDSIGDSL